MKNNMLLFYNMSNLKQLQNHKKKCYLNLATALSNSLYASKHTDANKDINANIDVNANINTNPNPLFECK